MALDLGELYAKLSVDSSELDRGLDEVPNKLKDTGKKAATAAAAAGAGIAVAMTSAITQAMDVEAANDKLAAQLGASEAESARLGQVAGRVYAGAYGDSLGQVNDTIASITRNIGEGNDEWLQSTTQTILDLSATFGQESDAIATAVGSTLNAGLFTDATQALDALTAGMQGGADKGGALVDTLVQAGPNLRAFGFDGASAIGLIQQGLDAGAESADSVTGLFEELVGNAADVEGFSETVGTLGLNGRTMAEDLAAGGSRAQGALDLLLDTLRNTEDPMARNAAVAQLFGEEGSALQGVLMSLDPSQATARLGEFEGAAAKAGETLAGNATTNIEMFKRQATATFVEFLGTRALPAVTGFASALATGFGPAVEQIGPPLLSAAAGAVALGQAIPTPILQAGAVVVGALALALGTQAAVTATASAATGAYSAVKAFFITTTNAETGAVTLSTIARTRASIAAGAAAVATGAQTAATGAATAAQWLLNAALTANPIGLVIAALALLTGGILLAWRESETFRNIVTGAFDAVHRAGTYMWEGVLKPVFRFLLETWLAVAGGILDGAERAFGWVPGIGDKLRGANREFDSFRAGVNASLDAVNSEKTITVTARASFDSSLGKYGGNRTTAADGGIWGVRSFADGGTTLPSQAVIQPGSGRGLFQWAEGETGGEAFIPMAPAKRDRSTAILDTVATRFGYKLTPMADGGITVDVLGDVAPLRAGLTGLYEGVVADVTRDAQARADEAARAAIAEPASGGSSNGLLPIMAAARQYVMDTYGVRNIGGYANRNIAGTNKKSDHASGKAIDIMIGPGALGNAIARDFAFGDANRRFQIENTIWQQAISSRGGPFRGMSDRGSPTQNHRDHIHADTYADGGIRMPAGVYDGGGWLEPDTAAVNLSRGREMVVPSRESTQIVEALQARQEPARFEGVLVLDSGEFLGQVQGVMRQRDDRTELALAASGIGV